MHIVILWRGDFPHGMALVNRFIALAKGLIEQGESVVVLCIAPAFREQAPADLSLRGTYQGIEYVYTSAELFAAGNRLSRILQRAGSFVRGLRELWRLKRRDQLDVIFFPGLPSLLMAVILLFGRLLGVKTVHERNEHPSLETRGGWLGKLERDFYVKGLMRFCSGIEVISTPLERLLRPQMGKTPRLLVVPAIVDASRFELSSNSGAPPLEGQYVAWCGSVWGRKDGVIDLIEAFCLIANAHPGVRLVLIGPLDNSPECRAIKKMVDERGLSQRVVLTGKVSQAEMPRYLNGAAVLALARPSSVQAMYGFPTKLPEYLATGRPVLVTRVGDIPLYLKDGENAYLADPDDAAGFAQKLGYILSHPAEAAKVGERGKMLAKADFSHYIQAGRLAGFFRDL